jgi:hypothetical protein
MAVYERGGEKEDEGRVARESQLLIAKMREDA